MTLYERFLRRVQFTKQLRFKKFKSVLDRYAPIKAFQIRKNNLPCLSDGRKIIIMHRKELMKKAIETKDLKVKKEAMTKGKEIKRLARDETEYYAKKLESFEVRKTAREIIGENKNLAPTTLVKTDGNGKKKVVKTPGEIVEAFNEYLCDKFKKLREKTNIAPKVPPAERLQRWLEVRRKPVPRFELKRIDKKTFRSIMRRVTPKRVHGVNWIDSFSLKIASLFVDTPCESVHHVRHLRYEMKATVDTPTA